MDTNSWTATEIGVYFRLLMSEWVNGPLPDDTKRLSKIAMIDHGNFQKLWGPTVKGKFVNNGHGTLINLRLETVRENQIKYRESQAEKGKRSAEKRWAGHITPVTTTVTERLQPKHNSSSSLKINNKTYSEFFLNFWDQYPNKKGKEEAFKAWKKHAPNMEVVIKAVIAQREEKASLTLEGKFCPEWPNASTWLNNKRWEDEIQEVPKPKIEGDYPRAEDVLRKQGFGDDYFK